MNYRVALALSAALFSAGCQGERPSSTDTPSGASKLKRTWTAVDTSSTSGQTSWACEGIGATSISEEADSAIQNLPKKGGSTQGTRKLEGELSDGRDKLAVQVEGQTLKFMTQAAVGTGVAEASQFAITWNDESVLTAVVSDGPPGHATDSFVLNKKSGFAVWTQSSPTLIISKVPYTQTVYLLCK
jgi:hypothetical protein